MGYYVETRTNQLSGNNREKGYVCADKELNSEFALPGYTPFKLFEH